MVSELHVLLLCSTSQVEYQFNMYETHDIQNYSVIIDAHSSYDQKYL